jgi:threonine/homoserine/homoserine lactone efflux protein
MTIEICLALAPAYVVLLLIPGPTVSLVVSYAIGQGWRAALPTAIGVAIGDFIAMTASMLGVGALLATSATFFNVLKWLWCSLPDLAWDKTVAVRNSFAD